MSQNWIATRWCFLVRTCFLYLAISGAAPAQTFEIVQAFRSEGDPQGALVETGGFFYGTTRLGGEHGLGTVFKVDGAGLRTTLHEFAGPEGAYPHASLILAADGNLYGTTLHGGVHDVGAVFRMTTAGVVTLLHSFACSDGAFPEAALVQGADGDFYGTTFGGGDGDLGTVFRMDAGGALATLHSFVSADGTRPYAELIQASDGDFYGTTTEGGANGSGTIYRVDGAGSLEVLHAFVAGTEGSIVLAGLLEARGHFYGAASRGGDLDWGTLFRYDSGGAFLTLHSFGDEHGSAPASTPIEASDGALYGTTLGAGLGPTIGTIYWVDGADAVTTLHTFQASDGAAPGGLVQGADLALYGLTHGGPAAAYGTVFRCDLADALTTLSTFLSSGAAAGPATGLVEIDAVFYGTTYLGGADNTGTIYKLDGGGTVTILHDFADGGGSFPEKTLFRAQNGRLYGTTDGTIYSIGTAGDFELLHTFTGTDGVYPTSLMQAEDGTFYGTASFGPQANGTIFRMDGDGGNFEVIHEFLGSDGTNATDLVQVSDGELYGVTTDGGPHGWGTLFQLATDGTVTTLHSFGVDVAEGVNPFWLVETAPGQLMVGALNGGNPAGGGTILRSDLQGAVSIWHTFDPLTGQFALAPPVSSTDGNYYGATGSGGLNGSGTLYRLKPDGEFTALHHFSYEDGYQATALIEATNGDLYGGATYGGPSGSGSVFRLVREDASLAVSSVTPDSGVASGGDGLTLSGVGFDIGITVSIGPAAATGVDVSSPVSAIATSPAVSPGTLHDVVVARPDRTSAMLPAAFFADFLDVPKSDIFHDYVETVFRSGITAGCGGGNYCRNSAVTRAQMTVFLLKAEHGAAYLPPPCSGVFDDVTCPGSFSDWIEQLAAEGITGGCGGDNYCPGDSVTRAQMAVFLLKTKHGAGHTPPACLGAFGDVACPSLFADWIEELYGENVTGGCQASPLLYCPGSSSTRGQMAVFLIKTFGLGL